MGTFTPEALAHVPREEVEYLYHTGLVGQAIFEAYMYVWWTSAPRLSNHCGWSTPPTDREVLEFADRLRKAAAGRTHR